MTSSTSIKKDDGTGIFLRTPNTTGLNSININVSGLTTLSNNTTIDGTLNISGKSQLVNDTTLELAPNRPARRALRRV